MERIVYLYCRKQGVTAEQSRKWTLEVDVPITSTQPGIQKFQVSEISSSGEGPLEFHVLEEIEVDSYEAWTKVAEQPGMKKVAAEWPSYFDETSILEIRSTKIE